MKQSNVCERKCGYITIKQESDNTTQAIMEVTKKDLENQTKLIISNWDKYSKITVGANNVTSIAKQQLKWQKNNTISRQKIFYKELEKCQIQLYNS